LNSEGAMKVTGQLFAHHEIIGNAARMSLNEACYNKENKCWPKKRAEKPALY
jgi:hypothetical protein